MIWIIGSFLFVVLASICNSIMDVISHHYHKSIFNQYNRVWWDGQISWQNKYVDGDFNKGRVKMTILGFTFNKPVQLTDAWHFFKMWMIIFNCSAIVCALYSGVEPTWWNIPLFLLAYGTTWNVVFSGFYDKVLKKK